MKDQAIATSLMNKDGTRSLETKLTGDINDIVLKSGKPNKRKIIGALLIAVPEKNYFAGFNKIVIIIGVISVALIVGVILFIFSFIKWIMSPLVVMVDTANRLADGDLTFSTIVNRKDEIGQLLEALSNMVEKWRYVVNEVKSASDNIASAGHQQSASAEQMTRGSSLQATKASQVATATEEVSQTVVDIARNASSIAASSAETLKLARDGETIVQKSVIEVKEVVHTVDESASFVRSVSAINISAKL
jgi:methyl-accepting chemotaxis protein